MNPEFRQFLVINSCVTEQKGYKCREETGVGGWERDCRYRRAGCYLGSLIRAQGRVLDNMAAPARCCENTITWPAVQVYYRPTCLSDKLFKHMALFIRPLSCQGLKVSKDLYFGYNVENHVSQVSYAKFIMQFILQLLQIHIFDIFLGLCKRITSSNCWVRVIWITFKASTIYNLILYLSKTFLWTETR